MPSEQNNKPKLSRRQFLTAAGGVTFAVAAGAMGFKYFAEPGKNKKTLPDQEITAWVKLNPNGEIIFYNPAAEMGQGSMTALAVIFAEEMDADWDMVRIESAPVEPDTYGLQWSGALGGPMLTVGSRTIRGYFQALRHAGAQARNALLQLAAAHWGVDIGQLSTEPGTVVDAKGKQRISYGDLAALMTDTETSIELREIPESAWKKPEEFRLIGTDVPRRDIPAKVDGTAQFAMDVHLPGMLYGSVLRTPVHGAKPTLKNETDIRKMDGVLEVVMLDHGVGIVADNYEKALKAKRALQVDWSQDAQAQGYDSEAAFAKYQQLARQTTADSRKVSESGNYSGAMRGAQKTYDLEYRNDFLYHAQMEPLNAVVSVTSDKKSAEVWVGTQGMDGSRKAVADALGIEFEQVKFHPCYLGGGFGRRSMSGYVEEAALLAAKVDQPVKLIWTREDDVRYGAFRPISVQRMQAGVDETGELVAWGHYIAGTGGGLLGSAGKCDYYSLPNHRIEVRNIDEGVRTKHWRSVSHGANKFAIETFLDEIAHDLGRDPLNFRLRLMREHPREMKVLKEVAQMTDWGNAAIPEGRARGLSVTDHGGSFAAGVAEISVDEQYKIRVHRFWTAVDAGIVVQPANTKAQIEGGIVMGISSVLQESITFKDGAVQQSNFHDYPLLRMADVPEDIEISLIASEGAPSSIGELSLPLVGGAIANAFLSLTGTPLRHIPFRPEKVKAILNA
ncbi:isoquinoline 1-oxidoreductase [Flavilitoribacter nigricans DSM 23189 = NBRC 102662]|uniref:Isoquinoline 1-oxidoreductase n=2 Tax=Flavilitoribacter TaxID=2762562 RepID=A0A2D0N4U5_FLAN2|nr:isoquinoline 1-oxidoreductase [Flavilitoribacter nigricans DSM 23189 = NBRC 102662]